MKVCVPSTISCVRKNELFFSSFSQVELSLPGRLEKAVDYINETEDRIRELKNRKINLAMGIGRIDRDMSCENAITINSKLPMVEVSDSGSTLNVVLISSLNKNVMLQDVITVLEEEGAEVLSASQYFGADRCLHVLHSQVATNSFHCIHVLGQF